MDKNLYYVCEFPEEEVAGSCPTAIISSVWAFVDEGIKYCFWPNFKSDKVRQKALINHTLVGPENSSMCAINIKYKTDNYEKACKKLMLLEQTSDLESQTETEDSERLRVAKIRDDFVSDIDTSDDDLPKPPRFTVYKKNNEEKLVEKTLDRTANDKIRFKTLDRTANDKIRFNLVENPADTAHGEIINLVENEVENPAGLDVILKEILRNQQKFSEKIDYLTNLLQNSLTKDFEMAHDNPSVNTLPLLNLHELQEFNDKLNEEDCFQKHMTHLKLIGGKDGPETTRRLLKKILGHNLSVQINWSGRNEKPAFAEYKNVIKLIGETVRKNPMTCNVPNNEIEGTIKLWLRGAMDREGGRSKRDK